eukprot:TRINITY_DN36300_c0_g1_i1.p1 TRINITY_DN36300_c0_g1~~TRINITY_DN36300_c0_g1_i1.p1  ORF type:complete len:684 (+),score=203.64 TRINITY_DN36300_c0_g1_i1:93-2054(+)
MQPPRRKAATSWKPLSLVFMSLLGVTALWAVFGSGDDNYTRPPTVPLTEREILVPRVVTQSSNAHSLGDFGFEGRVANLIVVQPALLEGPFTFVAPERKANEADALDSILKRWSTRSRQGIHTSPRVHTDTAHHKNTVVFVPRCDPDQDFLKKSLGCDGSCDLKEKIAELKTFAQSGPIVLVPEGQLLEGLVVMQKVFGFDDGDLLLWAKPDLFQPEESSCPQGDFHAAAAEVLQGHWSPQLDRRMSQLHGTIAAVPNYCQGLPGFSMCGTLKNPTHRQEPHLPAAASPDFSCPAPPAAPAPVPEHGADDVLSNAQWPRCGADPAGCTPKLGIVFIKTHKTASSTLEGILQRMCVTRRQRCFIHSGKFVNTAYPEQHAEVMQPYPETPALASPYSMFIAHTMNTPDLREVHVPTSQGHVLSIVREAAGRYESHWNFWVQPHDRVVPDRPEYPWKARDLFQFCQDASSNATLRELLSTEPLNIRLALNNMARQMMGCTHCGTQEEVERRMDRLVAEIRAPNSKHHVLLTERLHESLVLFKRDYGLKTADIMFASRNRGNYKKQSDPELVKCFLSLNSLDDRLYKVAVEVHEKRVAELGEEFQLEVREFATLQSTVSGACKDCGSNERLCQQCKALKGRENIEKVLKDHFRSCKQ